MTTKKGPKTYTLKLNAIERSILWGTIPATGSLRDAIQYARLRKRLELDDDEQKEAEVTIVPVGGGQSNITCKKLDVRWDLVFSEEEMDAIVSLAKAYNQWPSVDDTERIKGQIEDASGRSLRA